MTNTKFRNALDDWFSAMQFLLADHFKTTTNRLYFYGLNDRWPTIEAYPKSRHEVIFQDGFFKHVESGRLFSLAYPMFVLSEITLRDRYTEPFVRLLDEHGVMGPSGTLVLDRALEACFDQSLTLMDALWTEANVPRSEALLLRDRLYEYAQYNQDHLIKLEELERRLRMPTIEFNHYRYIGNPSTHAKAIKNLATHLQDHKLSDSQLCDALFELRGLLGDLWSKKITNLIGTFKKFEPLYDNPNPMVRDLYLVCLNTLVEKLFEQSLAKKADVCLAYLNVLVSESINLDINLARKSIVESVLGLGDQAADTWKRLLELRIGEELALPEVYSYEGILSVDEWRNKTIDFLAQQGVDIS